MKNNDYEIYIQDHHVGYARDVTDDMPNTGGRFEPKPEFEDYRLLFEQEMHFLKHKNYRAHEELMDAILRLGVKVVSNRFGTRVGFPSDKIVEGGLVYLHIYGGRAWWRPS